MIDFVHPVTDLDVEVSREPTGQQRRRSQDEFDYLPRVPRVGSLVMPMGCAKPPGDFFLHLGSEVGLNLQPYLVSSVAANGVVEPEVVGLHFEVV